MKNQKTTDNNSAQLYARIQKLKRQLLQERQENRDLEQLNATFYTKIDALQQTCQMYKDECDGLTRLISNRDSHIDKLIGMLTNSIK